MLQSIQFLSRAVTVFGEKCIKGIKANTEKCISNLEQSLALATAFVPTIGYDKAAVLAKEAHERNETVREAASKAGILSNREVNKILDEILGKK
jgi:fumarate hydratase class II